MTKRETSYVLFINKAFYNEDSKHGTHWKWGHKKITVKFVLGWKWC
ncbi:hypothetical protein [Spiroplasma tabanidicola]|nr:hypothetical protein [Spiroplasma tabanidicola]